MLYSTSMSDVKEYDQWVHVKETDDGDQALFVYKNVHISHNFIALRQVQYYNFNFHCKLQLISSAKQQHATPAAKQQHGPCPATHLKSSAITRGKLYHFSCLSRNRNTDKNLSGGFTLTESQGQEQEVNRAEGDMILLLRTTGLKSLYMPILQRRTHFCLMRSLLRIVWSYTNKPQFVP